MDLEEEIEEHKPRRSRIRKGSLVLAMSFFTTFIMYANEDLVIISMEIFLNESDVEVTKDDPLACNATNTSFTKSLTVSQNKILYDWDDEIRLEINVWYQLGYLSTQVIGGVCADKYGARRMAIIINLTSALLIVGCPSVIKYCGGKYEFLEAWSFVYGFVRGPTLAMTDSFVGQWIVPRRKTTAVCLMDIGVFLGLLFCNIFGRIFMRIFGDWSIGFYIFAAFQVIFSLFWYFLSFSSPETHPTITDEEKVPLREKLGPYLGFKNKTIPWKDMIKCFQLWTVFVSYGVGYYAGWLMLDQVPIFLKTTQKISFDQYPITLIWASLVDVFLSVLSDYLVGKNFIELSTLRKIFGNFGSMGAGIFLVATTYTSCIQKLTIALYIITIVFCGIYFTAAHAPMQDIAPNFAGTVRGVGSTLATFFVIAAPYILQPLAKQQYLMNWRSAFWLSLIFYTSANLIFVLSYKGKEQDWNIPPHLRRQEVSGSSLRIDEQKFE